MVDNDVLVFEKLISNFFGSPYALATASCTHAIELSLQYLKPTQSIGCPKKTYHSVPFILMRNNCNWHWVDRNWQNFYYLENTPIIDAAPLWREKSYIRGTLMCLSFNSEKPLGIGKGGMILTDSDEIYNGLKKLCYISLGKKLDTLGYHFYMDCETAKKGIVEFDKTNSTKHKIWNYENYPDLSLLEVFNT